MSIADQLLEVANNIPLVFEAGEKKHIMRYSSVLVVGNDTGALQFNCPFEPDYIVVTAHGATAQSASNTVVFALFDRRAFARVGGFFRTRQGGTYKNNASSTETGYAYFACENGICTVSPPSSYNVTFGNDTQYICAAVKYTDKTDKELLTEEISLLADTGAALEYSKLRINETLTDAEWQTLIATKPNRTFTLY